MPVRFIAKPELRDLPAKRIAIDQFDLVIVPGVAIFAVVLSVNLLGDRLRDKLDIRMMSEDKDRI